MLQANSGNSSRPPLSSGHIGSPASAGPVGARMVNVLGHILAAFTSRACSEFLDSYLIVLLVGVEITYHNLLSRQTPGVRNRMVSDHNS